MTTIKMTGGTIIGGTASKVQGFSVFADSNRRPEPSEGADLSTAYLSWRDCALIPQEHELLAHFDREVEQRQSKGIEKQAARLEAMLATKAWLMACLTPEADDE